ncbi:MAG: hypothetical protein KF726_05170 [Anaerolineae bacterium]|nr:hypothetical protein [Anaerolineae bacterium]
MPNTTDEAAANEIIRCGGSPRVRRSARLARSSYTVHYSPHKGELNFALNAETPRCQFIYPQVAQTESAVHSYL